MSWSKKRKVGETLEPTLVKDPVEQWKSKIRLLQKDPSVFDPEKVSWWEKGEKVPFMFLCLTFDLISSARSVTGLLCNMLRTVIATTPEDLLATVYLTANEIAPAHEDAKLRFDDASLIEAVSESFGVDVTTVQERFEKLQCAGHVAKEYAQTMALKSKPLTVDKVFNTLKQIAKEGSTVTMKDQLKSLLLATRDFEPIYLTRLLKGTLGLGFSCVLVLTALGQAAVYNEEHSKPHPNTENPFKEAGKIVTQVFHVLPVFDIIVRALLTGGVWNLLKACNFTPGFDIGFIHEMGYPIKSVGEILDIFKDTDFTCEYKYDGRRAQIHYMEDGAYEIFCRGAERNTGMFTHVLSRLKKPSVKSCILDCVIVPFDRVGMKLIPLQNLRTRDPKNVNVPDIKVDVCIFAFDMLYLNGQLLIQESLNIRREKLYDSFGEDPGYFQFATALTSRNTDEIQKFFHASVDYGCEGLIIKALNSDATLVRPEKQSNKWLKLKKEPSGSINVYDVDSVDLVPIAAFHHSGKPTDSYRGFILACYHVEKKEFQSICVATAGYSDGLLEERSSSLRSKVISIPKQNYQVDDRLKPDVWFEPTEVWEVKAIFMTMSPVQRAAIGIVDPDMGISLEFPRLVRVRADKKPEEATSSVQVAEMFMLINTSNEARGDND